MLFILLWAYFVPIPKQDSAGQKPQSETLLLQTLAAVLAIDLKLFFQPQYSRWTSLNGSLNQLLSNDLLSTLLKHELPSDPRSATGLSLSNTSHVFFKPYLWAKFKRRIVLAKLSWQSLKSREGRRRMQYSAQLWRRKYIYIFRFKAKTQADFELINWSYLQVSIHSGRIWKLTRLSYSTLWVNYSIGSETRPTSSLILNFNQQGTNKTSRAIHYWLRESHYQPMLHSWGTCLHCSTFIFSIRRYFAEMILLESRKGTELRETRQSNTRWLLSPRGCCWEF